MRAILRVMGAAGLFVSGAMLALADGIERQPGADADRAAAFAVARQPN